MGSRGDARETVRGQQREKKRKIERDIWEGDEERKREKEIFLREIDRESFEIARWFVIIIIATILPF